MPRRIVYNMARRLMKPSTWAFWKESLARPGGSFSESLHGWFYMRWPGLYIKLGLGRSPAARLLRAPAAALARLLGQWSTDGAARFADTYHGKAMPPEHVSRLITVGRAVEMTVPENVLPYSTARDILLHDPEELVLFNCPCRETVETPCLPLDVCIIVGKPFTDFMLEHHPEKSRRISAEAALDVVRGAHKRGHVSHAFFKEALMGRYYAICNCCSCCCGAMQAQRMGVPMLASSGFAAKVEHCRCIGCAKCSRVCQFSAIRMEPGTDGAPARARIDVERCFGCGVCTEHCPTKCISLERDDSKPAPLEVW